jgi:AraC-like DNA-binding protein
MLYVTQGETVLDWMGVEYDVPSPSLFMLTPNTPHRLRFLTPLSFWFIELDAVDPESFLTVEQAIEWNRLQKNADYGSPKLQMIRQTLESLTLSLISHKRDPAFEAEIVLLDIRKTILLIRQYFREDRDAPAEHDPTTRQSIQRLIRQMESEYYDPLDLTALARKVHLNPSYLVRAFKNEAGVTPIHYLNKLRLNAAVSYLANTEMGIQQIAEATGFNSIHYFSRLFKQKYGSSPQQWREQQKRGRGGAT